MLPLGVFIKWKLLLARPQFARRELADGVLRGVGFSLYGVVEAMLGWYGRRPSRHGVVLSR